MTRSPSSPSAVRAWFALLFLSARRLGWTLQSVAALAALGLLALVVFLVSLYARRSDTFEWTLINFSRTLFDNIYLRFVLPMLCLCYGTQAFGGEWEERNLVWLLTRPIPRPMIYLAKYFAVLPWCLGLSLAGLFLVGALAGAPGRQAALAFWPTVALGCFAYAALFVLLGAVFRRATIIGLSYCFVLETIIINMPGLVKRASLAFYTRCHFFGLAKQAGWDQIGGKVGVSPDRISFFLPVDGETATFVLVGVSVGLVLLGMVLFSRKEYRDLT